MKRLFLFLLALTATYLHAQIVHEFSNTPLTEALRTIEQSQTEYTISILSDGLENIAVTANVDEKDALAAVRKICKNLDAKVKVQDKDIYVQAKNASQRMLVLEGLVQDIRGHHDIIGATVQLLALDSSVVEQTEAHRKFYGAADNKFMWETSEFSFSVPSEPAKYIFRITHEGFKTAYVDYTIEHVGKREYSKALPPFYLVPEIPSKMMQELTVTASRVKFYYKGDTIIYNADAFVLAEGSMLDALLQQLPGIEMKSDGRIYHNGKFVNDLLLNGKEFFSKDRRLMLENLPAYTVKDIAVYDKQTEENEWLGIKDRASQRYVIDVRLKKEYMIGWIANLEAGGGTSERYLARLFAMRHTDFSRIAIIANANNLDDSSRPGSNDNWQRGTTTDLRRTERADIDFYVGDRNKRWNTRGNASINYQTTKGDIHTVQQNYLPTGDIYDYRFDENKNEDLRVSANQSFSFSTKSVSWSFSYNLNYHLFNHASGMASATFSAPIAGVSRQLLDDIYSPTSLRVNLRDTLINRVLQKGMGDGYAVNGSFNTSAVIKIPNSNESIRLGATIDYADRNEHSFDSQSVNYGYQQQPALYHHQYRNNHPMRDGGFNVRASYTIPLGEGWRQLMTTYTFKHQHQHSNSSLFLLHQLDSVLTDINQLPSVSEYQQVFDKDNSYTSRHTNNSHKLFLNLGYQFNKGSYGYVWTLFDGHITLNQEHMDYLRGKIDTTLNRTGLSMNMGSMTALNLNGGHQVSLNLGLDRTLPSLEQRIDMRDDSDPMNIRLGNPQLRATLTPSIKLNATYRSKLTLHRFSWEYRTIYNAIAMGYVYDTHTGVRTYRPENVNGNWNTTGEYTFHKDFGVAKKQNLDIPLSATYSQNVDLVGVDGAISPSLSRVHRLAISVAPSFKADFGKQHFEITCQPTWERLTSERTDFTDFSALTSRTTLSATLKLPWQIDLNTDFSLYTRSGYADVRLNTTDWVWNARLSRPFFKGSLLVMFDGFDILGQLSNVTRTINAQGRTETFTSVMPRYALLHVVYRFNKEPRKR